MKHLWLFILNLIGLMPFEGKVYIPKQRSGQQVSNADEYWNNRWSH